MTLTRSSFALLAGLSVLAASAFVPSASAQMSDDPGMASKNVVMVGGAPMYPSKNIVQNAVNSKDHTTLVAAVKAGGLVDTLQGPGPFTVFAPTNEAFDKRPPGTVATLVKPENKQQLVKILTYHVVPGRYTSADLMRLVKQGGGQATLKTVSARYCCRTDQQLCSRRTPSRSGSSLARTLTPERISTA